MRVGHDNHVPVLALRVAVDDQVVDHATVLIREQRVLCLTRFERGQVVGRGVLKKGKRVGAGDGKLPHVAKVEQPRSTPDCPMFRDDAFILNGHLPPCERDNPGAELPVPIVQSGALK